MYPPTNLCVVLCCRCKTNSRVWGSKHRNPVCTQHTLHSQNIRQTLPFAPHFPRYIYSLLRRNRFSNIYWFSRGLWSRWVHNGDFRGSHAWFLVNINSMSIVAYTPDVCSTACSSRLYYIPMILHDLIGKPHRLYWFLSECLELIHCGQIMKG